jgi:hypothetical protein
MSQLLRVLTFSPRLTIAVGVMLFGGIGGIASSGDDEPKKSSNAWSKDSSVSAYDAQKRADDGWGSGTKTGNSRDNQRRSGRTTQEVWVDRDGVIHEKEDMKAIDPDAYN